MYSLGIDIGTQNIRIAVLKEKAIVDKISRSHFGDVSLTLERLLEYVKHRYQAEEYCIGVSGSNAEQFQEFNIILDIPAIEKGAKYACPEVQTVIEIGAQTARYLDCSHAMTVFSVSEGCAGGTGSFLEQQASRVDRNVSDYSNLQKTDKKIPLLSGHCSVFTKTDIIHRQQEGFSSDEILLGICYATIRNIKSNLLKGKKIKPPVVIGGGVALNKGIVIALMEAFKLSDKDLLQPEGRDYLQAIGTGLYAAEQEGIKISKINELLQAVKQKNTAGLYYTERLEYKAVKQTDESLYIDSENVQNAYLGIDVGSTSVNLVLISPEKKIVDTQYLRTKGEPQKVVAYGLNQIKKKYGKRITIDNIGVTGSGRVLIASMLGANLVKDEITCQAKAACFVDNKADTVFEIGGQDSKYIRIKNGQAVDFQMNKICAAGTGSFLEEQARYLGIDINDYGKVALTSRSPVELGERCTVFIENNVSESLSQGAKKEDILAGLCYSVIRNYLSKVVGTRKVGKRIILQGGVCFNEAVIAAFQSFYGEKITLSPVFSVSGAFGAALFAAENTALSKNNQVIGAANSRLFLQTEHFLLESYENNKHNAHNRKKTIGIPRVLMIHRYFPLLNTFFEQIGLRVVLSKKSDAEIVSLSSEATSIDTCYPIKLVHGHIQYLIKQKLDYVLLPKMYRLCEANAKEREKHPLYGCPYMQALPELVKSSGIKMPKETTLLEFDFGEYPLDKRLIGLGMKLGVQTSDCIAAVNKANCVMRQYMNNIKNLNFEAIRSFSNKEKIFVIVTRNYNTADPILGMGIIEALSERGYRVITAAQLPLHDAAHKVMGDEHFAFGRHLIACAHLIRNTDNYYGIYLTNHGCGQDTMVQHLFTDIMGNKPCLNMEIDEHFSKVGLITRIEAFINTVEQQRGNKEPIALHDISNKNIEDLKKKKFYIPNLPPYSRFIRYYLQKKGYDTVVLPLHDEKILEKAAKYCTSKEYYSFVNYMADVVYMNERDIHGAALMMFTTEEAEAEAMYGKVLSKRIKNNVILPFFLEEIFDGSSGDDDLFYYILLGDLYLNSDERTKADILALLRTNCAILPSHILELVRPIDETAKYVFIFGEPTITYNGSIQNEVEKQCELAGYHTLYMPFSEYLCSLEKNEIDKSRHIEILRMAAAKQGRMSVFSNDIDYDIDYKARCSQLQSFSSGNGKYRYRKNIEMSHKNIPAIMISSMYENTQIILASLFEKQELQTLNLIFEGREDKTQYNKLESFLFYLKKRI